MDENDQLIGKAYKNITTNEINWLQEIDEPITIDLLDDRDQASAKLKFMPLIINQHSHKGDQLDEMSKQSAVGELSLQIKQAKLLSGTL